MIQDAAVEADHVQSRVVSIATVPDPPEAGTFVNELVTESWHFEVVGAVTCTEDEWQPATVRQAMIPKVSGKLRSSPISSPRRPDDLAKAPPSNSRNAAADPLVFRVNQRRRSAS